MGKEERRNGRRGRGNLVCAVCAYQVLLDLFCFLSVLIKSRDHKVGLMKVSGTLCVPELFMC